MGLCTSAIRTTRPEPSKYASRGHAPQGRTGGTITAAHTALHHDDLLALPRVRHGHARNRVDGVVRANDERHVRVTKVVIYRVHLQHDCEVILK